MRNGARCIQAAVKSPYERRTARIPRGINDISTVNVKIIDAWLETADESRWEVRDEQFHSPRPGESLSCRYERVPSCTHNNGCRQRGDEFSPLVSINMVKGGGASSVPIRLFFATSQ